MRRTSSYMLSIKVFVWLWSSCSVSTLKSALFSPMLRREIMPALRMSVSVMSSGNSQLTAMARLWMNCSTPSQALEYTLEISSRSGIASSNAEVFTLLYRYSMIGIYPSWFFSTDSSSVAVTIKSCDFSGVIIFALSAPERWNTNLSVNTSNLATPSCVTKLTAIIGLLPGRSEYTTKAERGSSAYAVNGTSFSSLGSTKQTPLPTR